MKISDVEFALVEAPGRPNFIGAASATSVVMRLTSDDGLQGWGEAPLPWRLSELAPRRQALLPILAGRNIYDLEEMWETLQSLVACGRDGQDDQQGNMLACGLEMAAWDIIGKSSGQPAFHFWGGAYRSRIPLIIAHQAHAPHALSQAARDLSDHGFHSQLLVGTGDVRRDVAALEALVECVGQKGSGPAGIHYDARGRLSPESLRQLGDLLNPLQNKPAGWIIDPLPVAKAGALATGAKDVLRDRSLPLALSRQIRGPRDVLDAATAGIAHIVVDMHRVGGLLAVHRCAAAADAARIKISLRADGSVGIGLAAMLQLAACIPVFGSGHISDYPQLHEDVLREPLALADGTAAAPRLPGLGIEVDPAKLEHISG